MDGALAELQALEEQSLRVRQDTDKVRIFFASHILRIACVAERNAEIVPCKSERHVGKNLLRMCKRDQF